MGDGTCFGQTLVHNLGALGSNCGLFRFRGREEIEIYLQSRQVLS